MRTIKFRVYTEIKPEVLGMKYFDLSDTSERNNTVMQFTGLLDKSGKEIYEGDYVVVWNNKDLPLKDILNFGLGEIREQDGCFEVWWVKGNKSGTIEYLRVVNHSLEIIGNIYENKDLLNNPKG